MMRKQSEAVQLAQAHIEGMAENFATIKLHGQNLSKYAPGGEVQKFAMRLVLQEVIKLERRLAALRVNLIMAQEELCSVTP